MEEKRDDVFKRMGGSLFRNWIESSGGKNEAAETRFMLLLLGIIAFVEVEAVKVIFRKDFGSQAISFVRLLISVLIFSTLAFYFFVFSFDTDESIEFIGSPLSFKLAGLFYGFLSLYVLFRGIVFKLNPNKEEKADYQGSSHILAFLKKDGWSQEKIQNLAEPLLLIVIGLFLIPINLFWGIPLVFSALSVWIHLGLETFLKANHSVNNTDEKVHSKTSEIDFTEVK